MKHFFYRIFCGIIFFILVPVILTLLIQGSDENSIQKSEFISSSEMSELSLDEDILPGILANEISMETEVEAIKAQAVIARTNCLRALQEGKEMPEGLTKGEMIRLWGQENFSNYYSQLESGVEATRGVAIVQNGAYIQAAFHKASAGYTRDANEFYGNEEYPYLKSVDCRMDIPSKDFLKVAFYTPSEFLEAGRDFFGEEMKTSEKTAEEILEQIVVTNKDLAGYVKEITIEGKAYSGEEIRKKYNWNSAAFSLKAVDGEIRVLTKGVGHGLGVSLYGANKLAEEGYSYQDILKYFYSEIEFVSQ